MAGRENGLGIWGLSLRAMAGASLVGGSPAHWVELGYSGLGSAWMVAVQNKQPGPILVEGCVGGRFGDGDGSFD
jgi:hypothetical protein